MPLPIILGVAAAVAGIAGGSAAIGGGLMMSDAKKELEEAQSRHEKNIQSFEKENKLTLEAMDILGTKELTIVNNFKFFSDLIEKIHNKPEFKVFEKNGIKLPEYNPEELQKASVGADILLGALSGAAIGTAGGFAAAGATTAAVMALGTASTGVAISSLSGVAATNATLAALGGGALAAGGGGMALGSAILGGATLGVGLLVGGLIFSFSGYKISEKADEARSQVDKEEKQINEINAYLAELKTVAEAYYEKLSQVQYIYDKYLQKLYTIVKNKTDFKKFTSEEKNITENTVLFAKLLYHMCTVKLVLSSDNDNEINKINKNEIEQSLSEANIALNGTI